MIFFDSLVIILGLALFESVSSIDNAVVNADVLHTVSPQWRKWFLRYGIFFAVFVVRGFLPLCIIYFATPGISFLEAWGATFSSSSRAHAVIEAQTPILLGGGGVFLLFLFFHWLFLEHKNYAFFIEAHLHKKYFFWFYSIVSIILLGVVWATIRINPLVSLGAVVGSTAFFIVSGFKKNAEEQEKRLAKDHAMTNMSKILYLELIDTVFSIDGVLGAFAFTVSIPLILIGNGIGAIIVRYLTVHGVETIKKYAYLKNGAMYSIGFLGVVMIAESLGQHTPSWVSPLATLAITVSFFSLSKNKIKRDANLSLT